MDLFKNKWDCCGCTACQHICRKSAITMVPDEEGFLYPHINKSLCSGCGLCQSICPISTYMRIDKTASPEIYAVRNKDKELLMYCSSGAVFEGLAEVILNEKGIVYGAKYDYDNNFKVYHSASSTKNECKTFRGSKYAQSELKDTFAQIKIHLNKSRKVLFSGTPCQVMGLKLFVGKTDDNLYTCDLICHGVPSPLIFKSYINYIEKKAKQKISHINMKDKTQGWGRQSPRIYFKNGNSWFNKTETHLWNTIFYSENVTRPSCHACQFANFKRPGDITIGDYWGIEKSHPDFFNKEGTSLVLINNEKGQRLFEGAKHTFDYIVSKKELCLQPNLQYPSRISPYRESFWADYYKHGFIYVAKKYGNLGWKKRLINIMSRVKTKIRKLVKR